MLSVLQFIFRDLPTFIGVWILLAVIFTGVANIIRAARGTRVDQ